MVQQDRVFEVIGSGITYTMQDWQEKCFWHHREELAPPPGRSSEAHPDDDVINGRNGLSL